MTDKAAAAQNPKTDGRYIIKAQSPGFYEAIKKLYHSGMSGAQVHKILDITKGDIVGLRVAKHGRSSVIWFTHRGNRYDVKSDGTVAAAVKLGQARNPLPPAAAKRVKCQLCGNIAPIPHYELNARCPACGSRLVRYNVVRRR